MKNRLTCFVAFLSILFITLSCYSPSDVSAATSYDQVEKLVNEAVTEAESLEPYYRIKSSKGIGVSSTFSKKYDQTLASINEAQDSINSLSDSRKSQLQEKLNWANELRLRAAYFIDSSRHGAILRQYLAEFEAAISKGSISQIDSLYDRYSTKIRKVEETIGKVYGPTSRKVMLDYYITPSKVAKERVIYEVSHYRLLNKINTQIQKKQLTEANSNFGVLSRLKRRAIEIKQAGGYASLPSTINQTLVQMETTSKKNYNNAKGGSGDPSTAPVQAVVTASALNVRSEPTIDSDVVGKLYNGDVITVYEFVGDWAKTKINNTVCYVHKNYLVIGSTEKPSDSLLAGKVITIDPGHGGKDSGAIGFGLQEKEVVLDVGLQVQKLLEAEGAKVIMTRKDDTFLDLPERAAVANNAKSSIFISLHINAATSESANGTETYWNGNYESAESKKLAEKIQNRLIEKLGTRNRGVKDAGFYVIKYTKMPSVLAELGFISNEAEAAKLKTAQFRKNAAEAILLGVLDYYK
ncbi:N-acetylmuramoyl-L-alanine amidase [Metabacillus litoralis]|uniref:N-acetylmuramoyl-L-alanine amidase n=1 Tax=Metabacillus litoralis TaxID=152268 RepID=UPI00203BB12C|nr:N-acetylmuramoyl-L-alanine amidase [Metabacillus litoralis]MCM3162608.1 N-acetylmuramoyl-L-alanine amidase [Metabacillus litoralis]